eukprot:s8614_g1.t1
MLLAIQLYMERAETRFHPFTQYAYEKLESYVESKKQITQESYRHFVEHAYNQFFVHSAFLESSRSRTKAKDIGATEPLGISTKLDGYVWIQDSKGTRRIPKSKVEEIDEEDVPTKLDGYVWIQDSKGTRRIPKSKVEEIDEEDVPMTEEPKPTPYSEYPDEMKEEEDQPEPQEEEPQEMEADQEEPNVPTFEVKIRDPQDTRSPEEEEVSKEREGSEESEESPYEHFRVYHSEEDRYGHYIMSFFSEADQLCFRQLVLGLGNVVFEDPEEE